MTPADARAMYRMEIGETGEVVMLKRRGSPDITKTVRARVLGYAPEKLQGAVQQGDRKIIVLAEDVEASGFPVPFLEKSIDLIVAHGGEWTIQAVDDSTRRVAGVLIAYEIRARG